MQNDGDFVEVILLYRTFGQISEGKMPLWRSEVPEKINITGV
jgi:hypothetical protein